MSAAPRPGRARPAAAVAAPVRAPQANWRSPTPDEIIVPAPARPSPDPAMSSRFFNLPMLLTWGRIFLIPFVVAVFYFPDEWIAPHAKNVVACVIFSVAAITDAFDGYFARKYGMTSRLGAFLDPVADKLMVSAALIVLLELGRVDALVALVIIGREITVSALREWMAQIGASQNVAVNAFGKFKTIVQMVAIPVLLYHDRLFGLPIAAIGTVLVYVAALLTIYSMFLYLRLAWPHLAGRDPGSG